MREEVLFPSCSGPATPALPRRPSSLCRKRSSQLNLALAFIALGVLSSLGLSQGIHTPTALQRRLSTHIGRSLAEEHKHTQALGQNFRLEGCPAHVKKYVAMHKSTRGKPGAKYVVFRCNEFPCAGLGDRLRGVMVVMEVALMTGRLMLIDWTFPSQLSNYLAPNLVDWTHDIPEVLEAKDALHLRWYTASEWPAMPLWEKPDFVETTKDPSVMYIRTNHWPWAETMEKLSGMAMQTRSARNSAMGCLFNILFKPSDQLMTAMHRELQAMFGQPEPGPYVAVHLRLGGLAGENREVKRHEQRDIEVLASALDYATSTAKGRNISVQSNPIAFVSDNHFLRWFIRQGYLTGAVAPTSENAAHLDSYFHNVTEGYAQETIDMYMPEFVEVAVLSRATCLIHTKSGFSQVAAWWANHTCDVDMFYALKRTGEKVNAEVPP